MLFRSLAVCLLTTMVIEGLPTAGWAYEFEDYTALAWIAQALIAVINVRIGKDRSQLDQSFSVSPYKIRKECRRLDRYCLQQALAWQPAQRYCLGSSHYQSNA